MDAEKAGFQWIRTRKKRILFLSAAAAIVTLLIISFGVNRFCFDIVLNGEEETVIVYDEPYLEQGGMAYFYGTAFFKTGFHPDVPVTISGEVDSTRVGKYTLRYDARYLLWHGSAQRSVRVIDLESPVIELTPDPEDAIRHGGVYKEAGVHAWDNYDGDITDRVVCTVDGDTMIYAVTDSSGNPAYAERQLPPIDSTPPVITLVGDKNIIAHVGEYISDPGAIAEDCFGEDLTKEIQTKGEVKWYQPGRYKITYSVADQFENASEITRTVTILRTAEVKPVIPEGRVIYLTFDDGPGPFTDQLLDILKEYGVKATFFVTDSGEEEILRRIVEEGHSIGIHTMTHNYREIYASPEAFFEDLLGMQKIIFEATGVKTRLMRFPGGSSNTVSSFNEGIMTLLTQAVEDAGFCYFDWNVDSNDAGGARKTKTVLKNIKEGVSGQELSVVLQHDIHGYSVNAVEKLIVWAKKNGYIFLPLQEDSPIFHHEVAN